MTKSELYYQIQRVRSQIAEQQDKQKKLEEKWDVLLEFMAKCNTKAEAFLESVRRRKNKLSGIDWLLSRMKAAMTYRQKMGDMLSGRDYNDAKGSIDTLMEQLDSQKRQVRRELEDVEDEISRLKRRLKQLQYEYDHYPEEEENDG